MTQSVSSIRRRRHSRASTNQIDARNSTSRQFTHWWGPMKSTALRSKHLANSPTGGARPSTNQHARSLFSSSRVLTYWQAAPASVSGLGSRPPSASLLQHSSTAVQQHSSKESTAAQQHSSTAVRQHDSTAAQQQHNSTTAQQHSSSPSPDDRSMSNNNRVR